MGDPRPTTPGLSPQEQAQHLTAPANGPPGTDAAASPGDGVGYPSPAGGYGAPAPVSGGEDA